MKRASLVLAFGLLAVVAVLVAMILVGRRPLAPFGPGMTVVVAAHELDPGPARDLEAEAGSEDRIVLPESTDWESLADIPDPLLQALEENLALRMSRAELGGVVVREVGQEEEPIAGAEVVAELERPEFELPASTSSSAQRVPVRTRTLMDGSFRFQKLTSGSYRLRAVLPTGEEKLTSTDARHIRPTLDVRFVFGTATLRGVVRATTGSPLSKVDILLEEQSTSRSRLPSARCSTDESGAFRFEQLPAGRYTLFVGGELQFAPYESSSSFVRSARWPHCTCDLDIAEGDQLTIDIGASEGVACWRGCLRTPLGDRYSEGKVITARREWRTPRGSEVQMVFTQKTESREGFSMYVPPGIWDLSVAYGDRDTWKLPASLRVGSTDIDRDLVIPGTRITGMILDEATGAPLLAARDTAHVRIRRFARGNPPDPDRECIVGPDGTYTLLVRGDGDWVLSAEPFVFASGRRGIDVSLHDAVAIHRLDLQLRQP